MFVIENGTPYDAMYFKLIKLIDEGKICEAEDYMFNLFQENTEYKIMMLKVYGYMNELDDDFLESNNFSREEIDEGIKEIGIDFKHGGSCLNEI